MELGSDYFSGAVGSGFAAGGEAGASQTGQAAASFYPSGGADLGTLLQLASLGTQGAGVGMQLAGGGQPDAPPASGFGFSVGGTDPAVARTRAAGASADLQSRGLSGAAPGFLQNQLAAELGLTPQELAQIMGNRTEGGGIA